jgi:hypothetical protein
MAKRTCVDRAAESGDWMSAENKAASALRKSGARLRQARAARDEPEVIGRFEGLTPDAPEPADMSEDDVQEYRDDGPAPEDEPDILPDDAQEKALAPPPGPSPLVRSPRRVVQEEARRAAQAEQRDLELQQYEPERWGRELERRLRRERQRGLEGRFKFERRELERRFKAEQQKYRALADEAGGPQFVRLPRRVVQEWGRLAAQAEQRELERQFEAEQRELERWEAERRKYRAWADEDALADEAGEPEEYYDWAEIEARHDWHQAFDDWEDRRWTRFSKRPGPPRDPPPDDSEWSPPSRDVLWKYKHRGFMTSFAGARSPGRPKKANKLTRAEIQKRYRDRHRARNPK